MKKSPAVSLSVCALAACILLLASACGANTANSVVVYTSVDQPTSEPILKAFEAATGVRVEAVYDVEAAKTTGLVSRLVAESSRPRADVFWSSEFAQTIFLKEQGLLEAYASPSAAGVPGEVRDPDDQWIGFAARARVIIVNTSLVPPERHPRSIFDLADPSWGEGEVGIANPLFGTTATHAAALFAALGEERAKAYFLDLQRRKARVVDGNSVVRDMVASGELKVGLTDTDDAWGAVSKGAPVKMIFPDQGPGPDALGTLIIPNTVALVRGAPHPAAARRLIDYLLSTQVEADLARSESLQIPVRAGLAVPPEVPRLEALTSMRVTAAEVARELGASSTWLKETFVR